ncbi:MAG: adenylate/guanylate cyclase domain-containing protein, partial [Planctomycetaceae bacterium]
MTVSIWQSYIPYYVAQDLALHPGEAPTGREQRLEAAILFADVSGFTAMSEALGKTGRAGAEELTAILNSYFGPMIELIQQYGGMTAKFGGDAMTVVFPYNADTRR